MQPKSSHRICIIGNSGSGKSTLAVAVGAELGIPVFHLDRELLVGEFQKLPTEEYLKVHRALIAQESWVIDGNYKKTVYERLDRATVAVFLDIGRAVTVPRVFRRLLQGRQPEGCIPPGANPKSLSREFLVWTMGYSRKERIRQLREACAQSGIPLLLLKKGPVAELVKRVRAAAEAHPGHQ
jgi:adenylate kinase family enzyme